LKKIYLLIICLIIIPVLSFAQNTSAGKDTITTKDGLKYIILAKGSGEQAVAGKEVAVNYIGYLLDGSEFDNSYERGKPFKFILGEGKVIKGWDEGIALMHVGDKFRLIIPPQLGYGENGAGNTIPPNATLIFDTQLMSVSAPKLSIADTLLLTIFEKGIDSAVAQYHRLYKTQRNIYDFDEEQLNMLAYRFMRNGMFKQAIAMLKLNIETYPDSFNAYDSIGEAYLLEGEKDLALQCYEKSLKLNPNNTNAEIMIKRIKDSTKK